MINFLLTIVILAASSAMAFKIITSGRFDFASGTALGFCFFIGGPLFQLLITGSINDSALGLPGLAFSSDPDLFLYLFASTICVAVVYSFPYHSKKIKLKILKIKQSRDPAFCYLIIALYFLFAIVSFINSGKYAGGHWMENNHALYSESTLGVIAGNFYNVLRVAFCGVIIYCEKEGYLERNKSVAIVLFFCAFELIVSSNRIMLLFSLIALFSIFRNQLRAFFIAAVVTLPLLLEFNSVFPMVRGLLWSEGASFEQARSALATAYENKNPDGDKLSGVLNSAFESANILVMRHVIESFPVSGRYLYGETIYLKSLSFFLPKTIWTDKPVGFNVLMGQQISGSSVLSLNSTLLGEAFGNFSWLGPLVFMFNSIIINSIFGLLRGGAYPYLGFFIAFAAWRFEFSFVVISMFVISFLAISFVLAARVLSFGSRSNKWRLSR
ncbi:hypothetical protein [Diaphorobacter sp.]|uniref:hypothetical protein n=1 Tax=Diaphorobacter sp. TaxID=1934310 RepID=UPI00258BBE3A|nr:hypothetical protein [Diaphorobacter sp.]